MKARGVVAIAIVGAVAVGAQLIRQTGVPSWDTIWAEDGSVFYERTRGVADLVAPHAGYMQLTGRAIGGAAHFFPVDDLARFDALAGAIVTAAMALAIYHFARELVPSALLRAIVAFQVVLLPAALFEQIANGVNALWVVLFAAWWALVYRPRSRLAAAPPAALVVLAACSSGLAFAYVPLAAWLGWRRRDLPTRIVLGAFAAGCVVQAAVMLQATDDTPTAASHLADMPGSFSIRVLASMVVGEQFVDDGWRALGWSLGVGAALVVGGALIAVAVRSRGVRRGLGLVAVAYGVAVWCITVWLRGTANVTIPAVYSSTGTRWTSLAIWFITSGLALLLAGVPQRTTFVRVATVVMVAWFALTSAAGFRGRMPRSDGPEWRASVVDALQRCDDGQDPVQLQVIPATFNVTMSCDELRASES